jgi:hypothetical protein
MFCILPPNMHNYPVESNNNNQLSSGPGAYCFSVYYRSLSNFDAFIMFRDANHLAAAKGEHAGGCQYINFCALIGKDQPSPSELPILANSRGKTFALALLRS